MEGIDCQAHVGSARGKRMDVARIQGEKMPSELFAKQNNVGHIKHFYAKIKNMNQSLSEKLEDYLEVILEFEREKRPARVRDIAENLSVHKSTVTAALHNLADKGLVKYSPYEIAKLTPSGRRIAKEVTRHHNVIRNFLTEVLLIDNKLAEENACRMEHVMDRQVLDRLTYFARFIEECPRAGRDWLTRFAEFVRNGGNIVSKRKQLDKFLVDFEKKLERTQEQGAEQ